jgi:hypothetical protein
MPIASLTTALEMLVVFLSVTPSLCPWQRRQKCLLTFLSLTTRLARTAMASEMLVDAYKHRRRVHTTSNGAREHQVVKHAITERSARARITVVALHPVVFGLSIYIFLWEARR